MLIKSNYTWTIINITKVFWEWKTKVFYWVVLDWNYKEVMYQDNMNKKWYKQTAVIREESCELVQW